MAQKTILDLEVEVLCNILEFVDADSPRSTTAVAKVCKHFNFVAQLIRYRRLTVHWGSDSWLDARGRPQEEWETPELLRGVRHLTVCRGSIPDIVDDSSDDSSDENEDSEDDANEDDENNDTNAGDGPLPISTTIDTAPFTQLEGVLRKASNLKTLVWKVGYLPPHEITEILDAHQANAELKVFRAVRLANILGLSKSERALAASSCLSSLSMKSSTGTCIESQMTFQVIVAMARKLKFASLVSQRELRPDDWDLQGEGRSDPKLWFPKDRQNIKPNRSLRHLTLDGWSLSAETLQYWSQYIHLASLQSFKSSRGSLEKSYFIRAAEYLPKLKHLSLNLRQDVGDTRPETLAAIERYIADCPPLKSLSLWSWRAGISLSSILAQHGPTLTELHLHEREESNFTLRHTLSLQELQAIRADCPQLTTLTFDLKRASARLDLEDYADVLEELRQFNLDRLQIYLDCGIPWLANSLSPICDITPPSDTTLQNHSDLVLPGHCEGDYQYKESGPRLIPTLRHGSYSASTPEEANLPGEKLMVHPPSTNIQISRFFVGAWKAVFGSRTTGPRQLDLKFGEWERRGNFFWGTPVQRDGRVWCRGRPHERDNKQGQCVVDIDCCRSEHRRQFCSV